MNTRTASCRPGIHHRDAVREFARSGRGRGVFRVVVSALFLVLLWATCCLPVFAFAGSTELAGEGATFPQPFYLKAFEAYHRSTGVKVHYRGVGSEKGIQALLARTVDFAGTDVHMTVKELHQAATAVLHVPVCLGAVAVTYNLPGNPVLNFTPELLADLFLGKIVTWNDPRISALNPEARLPDLPVTVVHRSDGSGTTLIFSEYMSKVHKEWKNRIGADKSVAWPVGRGAKGNPGVAGLVRQMPGSIGYVELIYAKGNGMTVGKVRNRAGKFIEPTIGSVTLAAVDIQDDGRFSITDTGATDGYPISGFTWIILYQEQSYSARTRETAEELTRMLWWLTHDGQRLAAALHYAPLPGPAVLHAENGIRGITYRGVPVFREESKRKR